MSPTSPSELTDVAIIGAGLTGLSAAHRLEAQGRDYRVIERLSHVGGHAITLEEAGYRFDRTGHLLHLRDPRTRERVLSWIGPHEEVQRRSAVFSHGVYTRYPYQANTFGLPPQVANDCLLGFIEAHFRKEKPEAKNFEEFCRLNFGDGISDHFMIPYNCRLWGVHPKEITAEWCQRFVPLPKLEDVVAGAVGLNDRELGYNTHFVYPEQGIGALPQGMLAALPEASRAERLLLEAQIARVDSKRKKLHLSDGRAIEYRHLISTAPLDVLLGLMDLPQQVAVAAKQLRCTHLYYLDVASRAPAGKPLHWAYVPEERYPFYRVGCYSNFSAAMAPEGGSCYYVELASREAPELTQLLPEVTDGLVEMGLLPSAEALVFARLRRIDHAYVIFDHNYYGALNVIRPYLESQGIISAGRYGDWNYSSMEDALLFGERAVDQLAEPKP
ncbi:MAG: FAD-dependent oxidoreductase [Polyangiaceae bacterium]|nr:FAD-dependent oxidoreductase [Myxococcales bacterium]MCB9588724.1 FAD-dependent oxidoreductase [Polyangiaceae bacterium]MCB9605282.1 FAD-dependent oxidoreductase [Polyangiaceae bacterium]